jgi:hypothetical protein
VKETKSVESPLKAKKVEDAEIKPATPKPVEVKVEAPESFLV